MAEPESDIITAAKLLMEELTKSKSNFILAIHDPKNGDLVNFSGNGAWLIGQCVTIKARILAQTVQTVEKPQ